MPFSVLGSVSQWNTGSSKEQINLHTMTEYTLNAVYYSDAICCYLSHKILLVCFKRRWPSVSSAWLTHALNTKHTDNITTVWLDKMRDSQSFHLVMLNVYELKPTAQWLNSSVVWERYWFFHSGLWKVACWLLMQDLHPHSVVWCGAHLHYSYIIWERSDSQSFDHDVREVVGVQHQVVSAVLQKLLVILALVLPHMADCSRDTQNQGRCLWFMFTIQVFGDFFLKNIGSHVDIVIIKSHL